MIKALFPKICKSSTDLGEVFYYSVNYIDKTGIIIYYSNVIS